jgi:LysR family transcriptional regulator, benzoate and cis,cis-muconate-responsive activator of ben and cat genes
LLRYFLAVAEELNFTRAAERLSIAQPAVSAQIKLLERQLGVQLLQRSTRSVELTDAGRVLAQRGPAALSSLDEAWDAARRVGRGEAGRLRIAYGPSTGYETTPRLVAALRERYPELEVAASVVSTPEIPRAVLDRRVDVGIARLPTPLPGVLLRTVRRERQGALLSRQHPLCELDEVPLAALGEYSILLHRREENVAHFELVQRMFAAAGVRLRIVEPAVGFDPSQQLLRESCAVGMVGESSRDGLAEHLRWIPLAEPAPRLAVQLVLREDDLAPAADRFERVAVATAAAAGWLGESI